MALYDLKNKEQKEKAISYFKKHLLNPCTIELTKKNPIRSLKQNAYLHLCLTWFALETGYDMAQVKLGFFKLEVNPEIFIVKKEGKFGVIDSVRSSADLDSAEMTKAIERFRNWSGVRGINLPAPGDYAFLEHIRIEESRQYFV